MGGDVAGINFRNHRYFDVGLQGSGKTTFLEN
jgi:signal recognition particle GTPase